MDLRVETGCRRLALGIKRLLLLGLVLVAAAGCSIFHRPSNETEIVSVIWGKGDQFVRIEKQDKLNGAPPPTNDHPVRLTPAQISNAFNLVMVQRPGNDETVPLFGPSELTRLALRLASALQRVNPDEDVTFQVESYAIGLFGARVGKPQITNGRVFYKDRQLNVIFGAVRDNPEGNYERRPDVVRIGGRASESSLLSKLSAKPNAGVYRPRGIKRADWLVFQSRALSNIPAAPETLQVGPGGNQVPGTGTPGVSSGRKGVRERMADLDQLRRDGVITEQEYQYKRAEILQGL